MRTKIMGASTLLASALGLGEAAAANETLVSDLNYQDQLAVSDESLTCTVYPGGDPSSYIPRDSAEARHAGLTDARPVFAHEEVQAFVLGRSDGRDARALCNHIARIKREAAAGDGTVAVGKRVQLWLVKERSYADTCYRYLRETLTVRYPYGVELASEQWRQLQAMPLSDCL